MKIRQEVKGDYTAVYEVVKLAFESAEHSDKNEHNLVVKLRESSAFIPELSLVATKGDAIIGHILFTKLKIGEETALALAPLSVHPDYQKQGVGSLLINEGHVLAKKLGYRFSVVLGSENYYPKFGYKKAEEFGIKCPFEVPSENFMAINFTNEDIKLNDVVEYAKEFMG